MISPRAPAVTAGRHSTLPLHVEQDANLPFTYRKDPHGSAPSSPFSALPDDSLCTAPGLILPLCVQLGTDFSHP